MNFSVITNMASQTTLSNLANTQNQMQDAVAKLSSGLRINKAADDAAGLAISQQMQAQVNGLNQANQNAQDGVSLIQTAEGGMGQVQNILQRMRTLAVQSSSDTTTTTDRADIQTEMDQLSNEIDDISKQTQFNGMKLLDGTFTAKTIQVGANAGETQTVGINAVDSGTLGVGSGTGTGSGIDVTTQTAASTAITTIDSAIDAVSTDRATLGAYQNRLNYTMSNVQNTSQNLQAAESNITNVNMAQEMSQFTQLNVLQQAGASILSQANQMPQVILKLLQ